MKGFQRLFTAALCLAAVSANAQSTLQTYVTRCQTELGFTASEVPAMNCNDGPNFVTSRITPINDYLPYKRINQNVEMIAACRWGDGGHGVYNNTSFISVELIIHNRTNGGTCFFESKDTNSSTKPASTAIVSPTNFSSNHPNADDYWLTPAQLNGKMMYSNAIPGNFDYQEPLQCVRCHSQGAYIASQVVAPYLAKIGLLNDGHDTRVDFSKPNHYFAVGSNAPGDPFTGNHPFKDWNYLIAHSNLQPGEGCSGACHARARDPETGPPVYTPIGDLTSPLDRITPVLLSSYTQSLGLGNCCMAPSNEESPWRWINADQPVTDAVEVETFTASKKFPAASLNCGVPTYVEAMAVENDTVFRSDEVALTPNKLRTFNLRDGLVCLNADQTQGGKCYDHQVSYRCPTGPKPAVWTPYYNTDQNTADDGDHEERSRSIAQATAFCGGKAPIAMRMQTLFTGFPMFQANAPADRLAQFSPTGLVCRNADQGSGQSCANYTVRYRGCRNDATLSKLKNAWVNPPTFGDRYLTTTSNQDGADTRAQANNYQYPSQDWVIEPVPGGNTIRLADVWSGKYLTAGTADLSAVQVKNSDTSQMRQQWVKEQVGTTAEYRFRNVGTGRYLTVGNYTGSDPYYAPIISQGLSNQNWASQRWVVQ
jgi:mucin-like protein/ricin-type beta-trefoil lectin protein